MNRPTSLSLLRSARRLLAAWGALGTVLTSHSAPVDFNREVRPLLSDHCYACHGPDEAKRKAGLRLDLKASAFAELKSGHRAVVPGDPERSAVVQRLTSPDPDEVMPPPQHRKPLSAEQISLIARWVEEGAVWKDHWAFVPPPPPPLPSVRDPAWPANAIDRFILARLEQEGLAPAPAADRPALLRRVTLALTGLPPTPEEVDAFVKDPSPDAYERVVDRLLASPHYGERLAVNWLDLARYADTAGYHFDGVRFMWLWRDWVIQAFNRNQRFDRFTVEQLAGDLLPEPTRAQRIATGFVRNNMTNDEGGADPDEYLNKYVADRVNTVGAVWMGMTVACAECHDHKFDPLSTREFYELYAFFHNVPEKGLDRIRTDNPPPRLPVPTTEQALQFVEAEFRLRDAEKTLQDRSNELGETQEKWERETLAAPPAAPDDRALAARLDFEHSLAPFTPALPEGTPPPAEGEPGPARPEPRWLPAGQPAFSPGRLGHALHLDGQGHADLGPLVSFDRTQPFSYGAWVRVESDGAILSKMEPAPAYRGFDLYASGGRFEAHLIHAFPEDALKVRTKEKFDGPAWRHVLVTYDGAGKAAGVRIYVNGRARDLEIERDQWKGSLATREPVRLGSRNGDGRFRGQVDDVRLYARQLSEDDVRQLTLHGLLPLVAKSRGQRSDDERAELQRFYKENYAVDYLRSEKALAQARQAKDQLLAAIPTTMIMEEMDPPRETYRLVRGDFRTRGERVFPATPAFLPPARKVHVRGRGDHLELLPADPVPGTTNLLNRLDLAAWLVSPAHPLTARVTVNRYWALFFGTGLVKTLNDFGAQGEWPTHPELLDWLACRFRDGDPAAQPPVPPWDLKALVRLLVTSRTFQQSAALAPDLRDRDPYNRLLARSPRLPLDAEFVRDHALASAGLLDPRIGGPSVKPYQPDGLWDGTDSKFVQDHGADLYRRGLYVFWRRSAHYPAFATFDAPNREVCTFLRQRTQTPLQSLVLMNDPAFVECARALAQRVLREEPSHPERRLIRAFRLVLGRPPAPDELATLQRTFDRELAAFQADPQAASQLLSVGESPLPAEADRVTLAALTTVANVLLNLNETITH